MPSLMDTLQVIQFARTYPASFHVYSVATLLVTLLVVFLTIKFAGNRLIKNHSFQEKQSWDQFRSNIQKDVLLLDKGKVDWTKFDDQRKEANQSVRRIHEKIEESTRSFTQCMAQVKKDVIQISGITLELKGAFEEHSKGK